MATSWTDQGASRPSARVTASVPKIRNVHIDELRTAINNDIDKRGGAKETWSEEIEASVTKVRDDHLNELRTALLKESVSSPTLSCKITDLLFGCKYSIGSSIQTIVRLTVSFI